MTFERVPNCCGSIVVGFTEIVGFLVVHVLELLLHQLERKSGQRVMYLAEEQVDLLPIRSLIKVPDLL